MLRSLSVLIAAAVLSGCAAMNQLSNEVSSFGPWPSGRQPASFAFERLPSQQQQPEQQQLLEDAARPALMAAGFTPAPDATQATYSVQLGARVSADDRHFFDDGFSSPWGLRGFYGHPRFGLGLGYGRYYPGRSLSPTYDREVLLLIRDRQSGQTLYETRAASSGNSSAINSLLPAMFEAAMKDFPSVGVNPRRVVTQITKP